MENFNSGVQAEQKSYGAVIGAIIIIAILILGALYFWGGQMKEQDQTGAAVQVEQSVDDELNTLEQELGSTEADTVDTDVELE